jgi:hypothetical protein
MNEKIPSSSFFYTTYDLFVCVSKYLCRHEIIHKLGKINDTCAHFVLMMIEQGLNLDRCPCKNGPDAPPIFAQMGHVECLKQFGQNQDWENLPIEEKKQIIYPLVDLAFSYGYLECLQYLHSLFGSQNVVHHRRIITQYPWCIDSIPCLQFVLENGFMPPSWLIKCYFDSAAVNCIHYLVDNIWSLSGEKENQKEIFDDVIITEYDAISFDSLHYILNNGLHIQGVCINHTKILARAVHYGDRETWKWYYKHASHLLKRGRFEKGIRMYKDANFYAIRSALTGQIQQLKIFMDKSISHRATLRDMALTNILAREAARNNHADCLKHLISKIIDQGSLAFVYNILVAHVHRNQDRECMRVLANCK